MNHKALLVALLFAGATIAVAQDTPTNQPAKPKTPVINQRQRNQHARIHQGVKSGELTKGEAAKLHSDEKAIKAEKQMAKSDGKVTAKERAKIRHDQNKVSREIYRKKHNDKTQGDNK